MGIVINLLPDVRQAKLREHKRRQLVSGISVLVWGICGGAVVIMLVVAAGQKVSEGVLTKDIKDKEDSIRQISGLTDALTAQQHLASLPSLYQKRAYMTEFLNNYSAADPTDVSISSMNVDNTNVFTISGQAKTFASVAKVVKALEASNVDIGVDAKQSNQPYFSAVSITSVSPNEKGVGFTVTAKVSQAAMEVHSAN